MTQPEQILQAVAVLVRKGIVPFRRRDVQAQLNFPQQWSSYDTTFQTMRLERMGTVDEDYVGASYLGVFRRVGYGLYELTDRGRELIEERGY